MHDVAAFLVRRDHRLAREIRDLIGVDAAEAGTHPAELPRLAQLRLALDAALVDWLGDELPRRAVTTAGRAPGPTAANGAARPRLAETQGAR